jgi:hypothetical protein
MRSTGFAYPNLFGKKVPPPAPRWAGNAKYNFVGGHNDRSLIPIEGLIEATISVLRREGRSYQLANIDLIRQLHPQKDAAFRQPWLDRSAELAFDSLDHRI